MGYSIDPISADCYEGTTCLINKFFLISLFKTIRRRENMAKEVPITDLHYSSSFLFSQAIEKNQRLTSIVFSIN
jgi:hypothetical protein